MEGKANKQEKVVFIAYIAATVFALHLGKMIAIMLSVLMTIMTNNINIGNRVTLDTGYLQRYTFKNLLYTLKRKIWSGIRRIFPTQSI